jgi:hypothetical protein
MVILTPQKLNIFEDITPINARANSKAYPYQFNRYIPLDVNKHKFIYNFVDEKIITVQPTTTISTTGVMLEIELPDKRNILAIFDDTKYTLNDKDLLYYNVYHSLINKRILFYTQEHIDSLEYTLKSNSFHWLWFRVGINYLNSKVITRALSWIRMNPEIEFHLWTNLANESYCEEFFSQVNSEELAEFKSRTVIHYHKEMLQLLRNFCEHPKVDKLHILNFLNSIILNNQDRASMIFKTDIMRTIILFMHGGWYSDFNDTYCFTPIKYLINPVEPEMIYLGSDYIENIYNNYIIYAPKDSDLWLSNIYKIISCSMNLYKILDTKEDDFALIIRCMIKSFGKLLKEAEGRNILDVFMPRVPHWLKIFNEKLTELFVKYKIHNMTKMEVDISKFIFYFKNVLVKEDPESPMVKRFTEEMNLVRSVKTVNNVLLPVWSKAPETPYVSTEYDVNFWNKYIVSKTSIYNVLIDVTYPYFMHLNNIGRFFIGTTPAQGIYLIPYCYVYENYCLFTSLGHMGDGSCTGAKKIYDERFI